MHREINKVDPRIANTTFVQRTFGGYLLSQVTCQSCQFRSNTYDRFLDLSLEIQGCDSLQKAFQKFTRIERLDADNKYRCPSCSKMVLAHKQFSLYSVPNVLVVQLKRYNFASHFGGKINKPVSYPQIFNIEPYMSSDQKRTVNYSLHGVVVHYGHTLTSGHYVSYIKNSNGIWYRMDDSNVSQVGLNEVLRQQAYILFYSRDTPVHANEAHFSSPNKAAERNTTPKSPSTASEPSSNNHKNALSTQHEASNGINAHPVKDSDTLDWNGSENLNWIVEKQSEKQQKHVSSHATSFVSTDDWRTASFDSVFESSVSATSFGADNTVVSKASAVFEDDSFTLVNNNSNKNKKRSLDAADAQHAKHSQSSIKWDEVPRNQPSQKQKRPYNTNVSQMLQTSVDQSVPAWDDDSSSQLRIKQQLEAKISTKPQSGFQYDDYDEEYDQPRQKKKYLNRVKFQKTDNNPFQVAFENKRLSKL